MYPSHLYLKSSFPKRNNRQSKNWVCNANTKFVDLRNWHYDYKLIYWISEKSSSFVNRESVFNTIIILSFFSTVLQCHRAPVFPSPHVHHPHAGYSLVFYLVRVSGGQAASTAFCMNSINDRWNSHVSLLSRPQWACIAHVSLASRLSCL